MVEFFAGVEGGATCSNVVLVDRDGKILHSEEGSGSNLFLLGLSEAVSRIADLLKLTIKHANLTEGNRCLSVGLALSGAEDEHLNNEFVAQLESDHFDISPHYFLTNDSTGTIATAFENGGISIIAGTGSACRLLNPDGKIYGCGGWGHIIGDGGSAYWISALAIRIVFDTEDGFEVSPCDVTYVKHLAIDFFELKSFIGILDHLYKKFDKSKFAQFCKKLAEGATLHNDPLCKHVFKEAGRVLARHVVTVARHADEKLMGQKNGLPVVTVGSVWKSFHLMQDGFVEGLRAKNYVGAQISNLTLYRLKVSVALGAAYLGAKTANLKIPLKFQDHVEPYFNYVA